MTALGYWDAYCGRNSQVGPHSDAIRLGQAAIAEQAAVIAALRRELELGHQQVPAAPAYIDLYPPGWTSDPAVCARVADQVINCAEAAKGTGQVTILEDRSAGSEVAAIVSTAWLRRGDGLPDIPESDLEVELTAGDLDGMRIGSNQGVRLTHVPTGLAAVSTSERSQLQNKAAALRLLRGKLRHAGQGKEGTS